MLQGERTYLFGETGGVTARGRSERSAAAAEQIDLSRTVPRRAGALLAIHFFAGTLDFAPILNIMRATLALGELPSDAAMQDIRAGFETKDRIRQFNGAGSLSVQ